MRAILLWIAAGVVCQAAEPVCPWLGTATAAAILDGAVTVSFSPSARNKDDGACRFSSIHGSLRDSLTIAVSTMSDPSKDYPAEVAHCIADAPHLRGIGNDAIVCSDRPTQVAILSRVRDRILTVRAASQTLRGKHLGEQARNAAEQASGSLF